MAVLDAATSALNAYIQRTPALASHCTHPTESDLSFLYGVVVVDGHADKVAETGGSSLAHLCLQARLTRCGFTGVCFFAAQALDRSPTGSAVGARVALAVAKGELTIGQRRAYHSIVSRGSPGEQGAFVGEAVEQVAVGGGSALGGRGVIVRTEGKAFCTDVSVFVAEADDAAGKDGFVVGIPSM